MMVGWLAAVPKSFVKYFNQAHDVICKMNIAPYFDYSPCVFAVRSQSDASEW